MRIIKETKNKTEVLGEFETAEKAGAAVADIYGARVNDYWEIRMETARDAFEAGKYWYGRGSTVYYVETEPETVPVEVAETAAEYGEKNLYTAEEFGMFSAQELNAEYLEDTKNDCQQAHVVGGDEMHHRAAEVLTAAVQVAAGVEPIPWQTAYLNAAYEAAANGIKATVTLPPARRHA